MSGKPLLIFDGRCGFCKIWIQYWYGLTGDRVEYAASQDVGPDYPQIPPEDFKQAVYLVQPDGQTARGAKAVFTALAYVPGMAWLLWAYNHVPGLGAFTEACYRVVAAHRNAFYQITRWTFGLQVRPLTFSKVEWLFLKMLAAIYFIAFSSFGLQIRGLIGERGILPLPHFLAAVKRILGAQGYWRVPTVFWVVHGDAALVAVCVAGAVIAVVLLLGYFEHASLICLFVLYLSLCTAGQDFMSFQWDMLLLEAGFLAIFLGSSKLVVLLFRWLLFRLMFLSGAVKLLSHDTSWRDLSAVSFHYMTQPLPTRIAWYMYQLPLGFQRFSTWMVFFIELAMPFLIFGPRRWRFFAAFWILFLQTLIFSTGNYAFFNLLTVALCLFLFDDRALENLRLRARTVRVQPWLAKAAAVAILIISGAELWEVSGRTLGRPLSSLVSLVAPFGIVNTYGLFAVMTTERPEIVVQGSNDGVTWLDYEFRYKAGPLNQAPRWVQPHQPRLDWQMWFAALGGMRSPPWFDNFMVRLLQGAPEVLGLLGKNPFPGAPPKYVRALRFDYYFTDFATRRATGNWWSRVPHGMYFPQISLQDVGSVDTRD